VKIPKEFDSKFRFILVAAERAKQIQGGAPPKIQTRIRKPAPIALQEVMEGLVEWEILEVEEEEEESVG
jgi:DNA-directed RNA polymerase subunit omega